MFFLVVKPMNAMMARLKRRDEEPDAPAEDVVTLTEIRDLLPERSAAQARLSGSAY